MSTFDFEKKNNIRKSLQASDANKIEEDNQKLKKKLCELKKKLHRKESELSQIYMCLARR